MLKYATTQFLIPNSSCMLLFNETVNCFPANDNIAQQGGATRRTIADGYGLMCPKAMLAAEVKGENV